jgi:hypothetical protein
MHIQPTDPPDPVFAAEYAVVREPLCKQNERLHRTPCGNRVAAEAHVAFLAPLLCSR